MAESVFYRTGDDVLARARNGGRRTPEVFHPKAKRWRVYPDLDTLHDARVISSDDAARMLPAGCERSMLEQTSDASVRAPVQV